MLFPLELQPRPEIIQSEDPAISIIHLLKNQNGSKVQCNVEVNSEGWQNMYEISRLLLLGARRQGHLPTIN